MTVLERLQADVKSALKAGESKKVSVFRYLVAQLHNAEIEKKGAKMTDAEASMVLQKEAKRRRDAIELFKKGGREDLVKQEEEELSFMKVYLPEEVSIAEIEKAVADLVGNGMSDFSGLMKAVMQHFGGRADGKVVSQIVKDKLGETK